jgi:hypothetical protein
MVAGDEILTIAMFLLGEIVLLLGLMAYLSLVIKTEYGIQKPWHFIFSEPYRWIRRRSCKIDATEMVFY